MMNCRISFFKSVSNQCIFDYIVSNFKEMSLFFKYWEKGLFNIWRCSTIVMEGLVFNIDQGLQSSQRGFGIQSCSSWKITHPPSWVQVDWLIPPYWFLHYLSSGFYWFPGNIQRKWQGLKYIQLSSFPLSW